MIWGFSTAEWIFLILIIISSACLFGGVTLLVNKEHSLGLWVLLLAVVCVFVIILVPTLAEVAETLPWREAHK